MTASSLFGDSESLEGLTERPEEPVDPPTSDASALAATASLYRKYRPQSFDTDDLVGQEHIVRTLRNAILLGRVAHAYLFSGPRGTGKTTTARVLAKAVNCLHDDPRQRPCNVCVNCLAINTGATPDVVEIDAASNRGIDDIRDLRERVRYAPTQLLSKVYIIDEAHQITGAAANAFLKTLEEPPAHTRFILATTDPEELLPTIVSRCQRFEFRRVSGEDITRRLRTVANLERIAIDDDALRLIARHATGSLRDALGLLEQLALAAGTPHESSGSGTIDAPDVTAVLGLSRNDRVEGLVGALGRRIAGDALQIVQDAIEDGEDPRQLNQQLLGYLRLLLIERSGSSSHADDRARELAQMFSLTELAGLARLFGEIDFSIKHAPFPQLPLEIALVEAASGPILERRGGRVVEAASARESNPTNVNRPTALRDRARSPSAVREIRSSESHQPNRLQPMPIVPLHAVPSTDPAGDPKPVRSGSLEVEQIAELWPNVRADVKALNRRVEALLSEVDPVAISGNQITLAVPYPFHRDKLNSDDVRETVGGVLSRLLGQEISLVCILRGEMAGRATQAVEAASPTEPAAGQERGSASDDVDRARVRLRAAKNIFDAEEIRDPTAASRSIQADDS